MHRCTDVSMRGRCNEPTYENNYGEGNAPLCYYHVKLRRGMLDSSAAIVIEDMD